MSKKELCLITVFVLSSVLLSGCSNKTTGTADQGQVSVTENPQKPYNDETMSIMQEIAASKDTFKACPKKKIREKYEKISYDAGEIAVKFQTEQLSEEEIQEGLKQMKKYKKQHDKLLGKIDD